MRSRALWLTVSLLAAWLPPAAFAASAEAPVEGVWRLHEYQLSYVGFTSYYSCAGIEDKLRRLLRAAGARDDVKVVASCSDPLGGPSRILSARVRFYALEPDGAERAAPAAPAAPQGAEHALGRPAPELKKAPAPEPGLGAWKPVEWRARTPDWIEAGDCELVEAFVRELLPMLTTRSVASRFTCVPHQLTLGAIDVRFETLAPLPKADASRPARPQ